MIDINLSRIHHLIKNLNDENGRINERLCSMKLSFSFTIYEKTREEDFDLFKKRLAERKDEFFKLSHKLRVNLLYLTYLKDVLAKENHKAGIDLLMNKSASLTSGIRYLRDFLLAFDNADNQDIEIIKDVEFYKSAFTEQSKSYNLPVYLFDEKEILAFRNKLNDLILEQQQVNDEIAARNQSNKAKVQKLETFAANLPDKDDLVATEQI